jgi:hypothetical protein
MRTYLDLTCRFCTAFILGIGFLSCSGCGSKEKIVAVSGVVTHAGQPVPGLVVSFVPNAQTETGVSTGETDEKGKYSLTVVKTGSSGAVVGTHKVWVSLPRAPFVDPTDKEESAKQRKLNAKNKAPAKPPADVADILKKYGNLDKSPLTKEVTGSGPIDLVLD